MAKIITIEFKRIKTVNLVKENIVNCLYQSNKELYQYTVGKILRT